MKIQIDLCLPLHTALKEIRRQRRNIHCTFQRPGKIFSFFFDLTLPVPIAEQLLLEPCRSNLCHIDVRTYISQNPLHMSQPPCKHSQSVRHHDLIFFHDLHQVHHHFSHINVPHIRSTIFLHKSADILIKLAGIRFALKISQSQNRILNLADVVHGNTFYGFADQLTVVFCKTPHHSHVDPDDLSLLNPYISGMRICMEEAILHHLFDEIIHIFRSDLIEIISIRQKICPVIDRKAVNIFHHQNMW